MRATCGMKLTTSSRACRDTAATMGLLNLVFGSRGTADDLPSHTAGPHTDTVDPSIVEVNHKVFVHGYQSCLTRCRATSPAVGCETCWSSSACNCCSLCTSLCYAAPTFMRAWQPHLCFVGKSVHVVPLPLVKSLPFLGCSGT